MRSSRRSRTERSRSCSSRKLAGASADTDSPPIRAKTPSVAPNVQRCLRASAHGATSRPVGCELGCGLGAGRSPPALDLRSPRAPTRPPEFARRVTGNARCMDEPPEKSPTEAPEPAGTDPADRSADPDPHHSLNNPVGEPDPTEWPDPYDTRPDPRDPNGNDVAAGRSEQPHTVPGSQSTSEPNPKQDPEAQPWAEGPKRDKVDR